MRICTFLFLLIAVIFPGVARAYQDTTIRLTAANYETLDLDDPYWKFKAGDSMHWAAKDWNDTGWVRVSPLIRTLKGAREMGFKGIGWFRLHLQTDASFANKPFLLSLTTNGAAEIYLDGEKLHSYGKILHSEKSEYVTPYLPVIIVLKDTGRHVIALRYENIYYEGLLKSWNGNIGGVSFTLGKFYPYFERQKEKIMFFSLFLLLSGGIFFALFLSHLVMYLFHKKYSANLIFSLFNLGLGVFFTAVYLKGLIENFEAQGILMHICVLAPACSLFILSLLVNRLFSWSKVRIIISVLLLLTVVGITVFVNSRVGVLVLLLLLTYGILEATIMVIVAIKKKIPGSGILGFGILCAFLLFAFITIGSMLGDLNFNGYSGVVFVIVCMLAIFSLPLSMSAYLSWSFARVNKDLKVQLNKVEELSHTNLLQEQEKQRILESRKEELENEVAIRTKEVVLQKQQVEIEKKKSDDLLLNILPQEVAEELKENGATKARHFDDVSVLFTDFVNFTRIAEQLTPEQLVQELHECFRAFDDIIERNGMEKIKTIGDAYLAVSGIPVTDKQHAFNAVKAGLEIVDFIRNRKGQEQAFEVRVGINSGSLVAGIVGVKKFAYDIWGDTVNTAARMESSGEAGRVNISESTHALVQHDFSFIYRGKINAKNKGAVDMYFVDELITIPHAGNTESR